LNGFDERCVAYARQHRNTTAYDPACLAHHFLAQPIAERLGFTRAAEDEYAVTARIEYALKQSLQTFLVKFIASDEGGNDGWYDAG
jgi:hypothetical protein